MITTQQQPIAPRVRTLLRTVYAAGFIGTGYALWDLLTHGGGLQPGASLAIVVLVEFFGIAASTYSTRARLRGDGGFIMRNVVSLGALTSGGAQLFFHWNDNRVLATLIPVGALLALTLWILDVNDQHARVFEAQRQERKARRKTLARRLFSAAAYAYARGIKETHAEWKERVSEVGYLQRDVSRQLDVISITEALPEAPAWQIGHPVSPPPVDTVDGDDEYADALRQCATATAAARYAWTVFGADGSPTDITRWLDSYGVKISRTAVSMQRPKALSA